MTSTTVPSTRSCKWVPWAIVLFFVAQTAFFSWLGYVAHKTNTGIVTEQAYEKGLAYNDTIAKSEKQEALGYTSAIEHKGNQITFFLKDKKGTFIRDAKVTLWLYRPAHDGEDTTQIMSADSSGYYKATITPPEKGLWEIRIHAQRNQDSYQSSKRIVLE